MRRLTHDDFLARLEVAPNGCWIWIGRLGPDGRGRWGCEHSLAHRYSYTHYVGPIPTGLEIDHLCRAPRCVNPEHLEPVTRLENMRRRYAVYTHCKHGHEFTPENTYVDPTLGRRGCRACKRRIARESKRRKKVTSALRSLWRNDPARARVYIARMSPAELAEAHMNAQRLVLLIQSLTPEGVAMAILQPDSLPDGVDGFSITGRTS